MAYEPPLVASDDADLEELEQRLGELGRYL